MLASELKEIIQRGQSSKVQFKERLPNIESTAHELIAFSNRKGGTIIIGVNDKTGTLNGLSFQEIQSINQQLVNIASNNILPPIFITTETIGIDENNLLVIGIDEGISKPYKDRNGTIFLKNGSDKRKVTSNDEIARLLQSSKVMFADELTVPGTSILDIDTEEFERFIQRKYKRSLEELGILLPTALQNLSLGRNDELTLAGLLLFSKNRQKYRPQFSVQCVSVNDTVLTGNYFEDNEPPINGSLSAVFDKAIGFIDRNMKKKQTGSSFNSLPEWEIPYEVFEELIVNALIHRDYFIQSTIKVFIFIDRIELISPGKLPNSLTIENIRNGISIARNPILLSVAQYILPYKGLGTGVSRAISLYPNIRFVNDVNTEQFKAIIPKPTRS